MDLSLKSLKKTFACTLIAALLSALPGPAVPEALAQAVIAGKSAPAVSPVLPVGLGDVGLHNTLSQNIGGLFTAPALPLLSASADELKTLPTPASISDETAQAAAPVQAKGLPGLWQRAVQTGKEAQAQKAAKKQAKKQAEIDAQDHLINRVVAISDAMEAKELGKQTVDAARAVADANWDNASQPSASAVVPNPAAAERDHALGSVQNALEPAALEAPAKDGMSDRSPPAPSAETSAPASRLSNFSRGVQGLLILSGRGIAKIFSRKKTAEDPKPEQPRKDPVPMMGLISKLLRPVPAPLRVALAAAGTVGFDMLSRSMNPTMFGFSALTGLWVVVGVGAVIAPLLLADRIRLAKDSDKALTPLKSYEDVLLGVFLGAAVATAVGILTTGGLSLSSLIFQTLTPGKGFINPAAFLGLMSLMSSMPVLYASGHVAYALIHKKTADLSLPLPGVMKIMLLSLLLTPGQFLMNFSGPVGGLSYALFFVVVQAYFNGSGYLKSLVTENAVQDEPDAAPQLGREWTVGSGKVRPEAIKTEVRSAGKKTALLMGGMLLASIGIYGLLTFAPLDFFMVGLPSLVPMLKSLVPLFMASGYLAALFFGGRVVKKGPDVDMIRGLADKAHLPMPTVFATKDEQKSPNAFASGAIYHLSVVAFVGAIRKLLTPRELRGVMGHELSHVRYRHMLIFFAAVNLLQAFSAVAGQTFFQNMIALWAPVVWLAFFLAIMRSNEFMADAGSASLTQDPRSLGTGLRRLTLFGQLGKDRLPESAMNPLYRLMLTHPEMSKRVAALNGMMEPSEKK
jgi:heat shock protein HtpX